MFVYKTGIPAMDDQELILNAANDLLNNVPDMWDKGAYCYRFPNRECESFSVNLIFKYN